MLYIYIYINYISIHTHVCKYLYLYLYVYLYIYIYTYVYTHIFTARQSIATHCNALVRSQTATDIHTATHCITLQHTATYCNILQHIYTYTHTPSSHKRLYVVTRITQHTATHCNTLQHTVTHCNTATHCIALQQTPPEILPKRPIFRRLLRLQNIWSVWSSNLKNMVLSTKIDTVAMKPQRSLPHVCHRGIMYVLNWHCE